MGEWLRGRAERLVDSAIVAAGIVCGVLGALLLFGALTATPAPSATAADEAPSATAADEARAAANLKRVEQAERRADATLGPVDMNAFAYPQEDAQP